MITLGLQHGPLLPEQWARRATILAAVPRALRTSAYAMRLGWGEDYLAQGPWDLEEHPTDGLLYETRVPLQEALDLVTEEGEAGVTFLARLPKFRLGEANGEHSIAWLWRQALAARSPGVIWNQALEEVHRWWGWMPNALVSWPVGDVAEPRSLTAQTLEEARAALPPALATLPDEAVGPATVMRLQRQSLKPQAFFQLAEAWCAALPVDMRRHLLAYANPRVLRMALWRSGEDLTLEELRQVRTEEWHGLLRQPDLPPVVRAAAWEWMARMVEQIRLGEAGLAPAHHLPHWGHDLSGQGTVYAGLFRLLLEKTPREDVGPAREALWSWLNPDDPSAGHSEPYCETPRPQDVQHATAPRATGASDPSAATVPIRQWIAWEVLSHPAAPRTPAELQYLVETSNTRSIWLRLLQSRDTSRAQQYELLKWVGEQAPRTDRPLPRWPSAMMPDADSRQSTVEMVRWFEQHVDLGEDLDLVRALTPHADLEGLVRLATRVRDPAVLRPIVDRMMTHPPQTVLALMRRADFAPLMAHIPMPWLRPLLQAEAREQRVAAIAALGAGAAAREAGQEIRPIVPKGTLRKKLRRI